MSDKEYLYERRSSDLRLNRIEEKIDRLAEAMISLARAEEKISAMEDDRETYWESLNKLTAKMDIMEGKVEEAARTVNILHKLFWVGVAGASAYVVPGFLQSLNL